MKISRGFKRETSAHQMNKRFQIQLTKRTPEHNVITFRVRSSRKSRCKSWIQQYSEKFNPVQTGFLFASCVRKRQGLRKPPPSSNTDLKTAHGTATDSTQNDLLDISNTYVLFD